MGRGIAIVREIIGEYGGELRLQSDAEHTVFSGRLPKEAAQQTKGEEA